MKCGQKCYPNRSLIKKYTSRAYSYDWASDPTNRKNLAGQADTNLLYAEVFHLCQLNARQYRLPPAE